MAKSKSIGNIYAELSLRDKMSSALNNAGKNLAAFGKRTAKLGFAGLAAGTAGATAALIAGTKHTLSQTDALTDLAAQTGISIGNTMKLQQAYKDGGREAEMMGKDIGKMQKAIVGAASGGQDPFAVLGLSAAKLEKLDPATQFDQIGSAIMRISNPAERTAKALEIFGKGGMGLLTVFGGFKDAEKALGRMPELAEKFGAAMNDANDTLGHLPLKSDQFFMGFTAGIIGELLPALKQIDEHDFTTLGENLGTALGKAFETISNGTIWELFQAHAEKAMVSIQSSPYFGEAIQGMAAAINTIWGAFDGTASNNGLKDFDKYALAGVEANKEVLDDLQKRIDELNAKATAGYGAKQDAAAGMGNKPSIVNPISTLPFMPGPKMPDLTDEYARRGLDLGSGHAGIGGGTEDKQTKILEDMREFLKTIAGSRMKQAAAEF